MFAAFASEQSGEVAARIAAVAAATSCNPDEAHVEGIFGCLIDPGTAELSRGCQSLALGRLRVEPIARRGARGPGERDTLLDETRRLFDDSGVTAIGGLAGTFALVFWNQQARELVAVRDRLGLAPLYFREANGSLLLADSLDAFADAPFDLDYIAQFIAAEGNPDTTTTIRKGVHAVPPASSIHWKDGRVSIRRYWTPEDVSSRKLSLSDAAHEFRQRLAAAVAVNVDSESRTWAHLSGGLDSSSVVSAAAIASGAGEGIPALGGTITLKDSLGNADESEFVNEVLHRYPLKNVSFTDVWPWQADDGGPPQTDRPSRDYPFYARDRAVAAAVATNGGTALLSGIGPDIYLPFTVAQCPDLLWRGHIRTAVRELHGWSVAKRQPFWRVALHDGLLPLVSSGDASADAGAELTPQRWFTAGFVREHGRNNRRTEAARRGGYYPGRVARGLSSAAARLSNWLYSPGVEVRHPLLHPPLVEFCLGLPHDLRTDVYWPKPVLRTAMDGILPERVRLRVSKAIIAPRIYWAFRHERPVLDRLLAQPVLAELGCIEPARVRETLNSFELFSNGEAAQLYALLSLETWLSAKTGRRTDVNH